MKYVRQLLIILAVSLLGELLHFLLPLPVPASIYGIVLFFLALAFRIVPLAAVKETGDYLLAIMPLLFIPSGVGLIEDWGILRGILVPVVVISLVSTPVVMAAAGCTAQAFIRRRKDDGHE